MHRLIRLVWLVVLPAATVGVVSLADAASTARPSLTWRVLTLPVGGKPFSYAEPGLAVSPSHKTLIADAASANTGAPPTFWISRNGGRHWSIGRDFDPTGASTGDADAAVGPDGYLYVLNLGYNANPPGQPANPTVLVFRTRTGRSWSGPASFPPPHGLDQPDRPWLVVNPRRSANVDVVNSEGGGNIVIWRSFDHGARFTGPGPVTGGANSQAALALSSRPLFDPTRPGRLFMLYESASPIGPSTPGSPVYEFPLTQIWLATSRDGDASWSNQVVLNTASLAPPLQNATIGHLLVASAIDRRGDLYAAFSLRQSGATKTTVYLVHSTSHGQSWSRPAKVPAPTGSNVMPALAVARPGEAYLSWYGSGSPDFRSSHAAWQEMFAMTRDALAPHPHFMVSQVSRGRPVHVGGIDTAGTLGSNSGADWGLRDFQSISVGACGQPHLVWADDNRRTATETASPRRACPALSKRDRHPGRAKPSFTG